MSRCAASLVVWACLLGVAQAQTSVLAIAAGVDDTIVSVLDYGAVPNDGLDDGAAIQAALTSLDGTGGVVFVPRGRYDIANRTLTVPNGVSIVGEARREGSPASASYLLQTGTAQTLIDPAVNSKFSISNLLITATGHAIDVSVTSSSHLSDLVIKTTNNGYWCVYGGESVFDLCLTNIYALNDGVGNGIMLGMTNRNLVAQGCNVGLRAHGLNLTLDGFRCEVNRKALEVGIDHTGGTANLSDAITIQNGQLESNNFGIELYGRNLIVRNIYIQAFEDSCLGGTDPVQAMRIRNVTRGTFEHIGTGGDFEGMPAFEIQQATHCFFSHCTANNAASSGEDWSAGHSVMNGNGNEFHLCNLRLNPSDSLEYESVAKAFRTYSVHGVDFLTAAKQGKNVRFIGVPVSAGQTTKAVAFSPNVVSGNLFWTSATAQNNGGAALPAGSYYYTMSYLTQGGEIRGPDTSVTVEAPNNSVALSVGSTVTPDNYIFRLWRGKIYSTGTISSSGTTVTLTGGTWPVAIADGSITADAQTIGVDYRVSDSVIVLDSAPSAPFSADSFTANTGRYDGYYQLTPNTWTHTDTGAAFTVAGTSPPWSGMNDISMIEPDALYGVLVTPSWLTTHRVTSKATTGFTVDFGTAAPGGGGTFDVMIVR